MGPRAVRHQVRLIGEAVITFPLLDYEHLFDLAIGRRVPPVGARSRIKMRVLSRTPTGGDPRMPGTALCLDEREEIRAGLCRKESFASIAELLDRDPSTISREVRRNGGRNNYRAVTAQRRADKQRQRPKHYKLLTDSALAKAVTIDLSNGFSPAAVSARLRQAGGSTVATETIYQALYDKKFRGLTIRPHRCLRSRRRLRRRRLPRADISKRNHTKHLGDIRSVHDRPAAVLDRSEPGHWEGDLIVGANNRTAVITLVERTSRFTLLGHLPGRHGAHEVLASLADVFTTVPPGLRRTLTWDRGLEMCEWRQLEAMTSLDVYFCDAHAPWQ
jgi:IS30 family transposase